MENEHVHGIPTSRTYLYVLIPNLHLFCFTNLPMHLITRDCMLRSTMSLKVKPSLYCAIGQSIKQSTAADENIPDYISDAGIPEIAFEKEFVSTVLTPYGSFPLFLADGLLLSILHEMKLTLISLESVAAAWYHAMLSGSRMQGPFGSTEAVNITGTAISPLVTWVRTMVKSRSSHAL